MSNKVDTYDIYSIQDIGVGVTMSGHIRWSILLLAETGDRVGQTVWDCIVWDKRDSNRGRYICKCFGATDSSYYDTPDPDLMKGKKARVQYSAIHDSHHFHYLPLEEK